MESNVELNNAGLNSDNLQHNPAPHDNALQNNIDGNNEDREDTPLIYHLKSSSIKEESYNASLKDIIDFGIYNNGNKHSLDPNKKFNEQTLLFAHNTEDRSIVNLPWKSQTLKEKELLERNMNLDYDTYSKDDTIITAHLGSYKNPLESPFISINNPTKLEDHLNEVKKYIEQNPNTKPIFINFENYSNDAEQIDAVIKRTVGSYAINKVCEYDKNGSKICTPSNINDVDFNKNSNKVIFTTLDNNESRDIDYVNPLQTSDYVIIIDANKFNTAQLAVVRDNNYNIQESNHVNQYVSDGLFQTSGRNPVSWTYHQESNDNDVNNMIGENYMVFMDNIKEYDTRLIDNKTEMNKIMDLVSAYYSSPFINVPIGIALGLFTSKCIENDTMRQKFTDFMIKVILPTEGRISYNATREIINNYDRNLTCKENFQKCTASCVDSVICGTCGCCFAKCMCGLLTAGCGVIPGSVAYCCLVQPVSVACTQSCNQAFNRAYCDTYNVCCNPDVSCLDGCRIPITYCVMNTTFSSCKDFVKDVSSNINKYLCNIPSNVMRFCCRGRDEVDNVQNI